MKMMFSDSWLQVTSK